MSFYVNMINFNLNYTLPCEQYLLFTTANKLIIVPCLLRLSTDDIALIKIRIINGSLPYVHFSSYSQNVWFTSAVLRPFCANLNCTLRCGCFCLYCNIIKWYMVNSQFIGFIPGVVYLVDTLILESRKIYRTYNIDFFFTNRSWCGRAMDRNSKTVWTTRNIWFGKNLMANHTHGL